MSLLRSEFSYEQTLHGKPYTVGYYSDSASMDPVAPHQHTYCEIYILLSDRMQYKVGDHVEKLKAYDMLFIPPKVIHYPLLKSLTPGSSYQRVVIQLTTEYIQKMSDRYGFDIFLPFSVNWPHHKWVLHTHKSSRMRLMETIEEGVREAMSTLPGSDMLVQQMICRILLQSIRHMENIPSDFRNGPESEKTRKISEICWYIQQNCDKKLTLDTLAEHFYTNKFYLAHEFRSRMGISVGRYITKTRMEYARDMLLRDYPPTKLYIECGFSEYTTFYRAFKAEYGMGPKEYLEKFNETRNNTPQLTEKKPEA